MKVYISPYLKYHNRGQHVEVEVHEYDTWSLDHTLAHVIHPALVKFREDLMGAPEVDMNDVPEHLRDDSPDDPWADGGHWFQRWEWVVDEMIFAFNEIANVDDIDREFNTEINERIENGLRLFGKYYRGLWT